MDLRQLRQFVAVAEELSFRRAAERLHVSQPPLSMAIQRLEAQVGVLLLERTRHRVALTVAGAAFLEEARRTLEQARMSVEVARRAAAGQTGTLRLSFVPSAGFVVVPELLRTFGHDHPAVKVLLDGETTARQLVALEREAVDAGIVVPPIPSAGELILLHIREQELVLAIPDSHALRRQRRVQLRELAGESFVGFQPSAGPGFEAVVAAACQASGFLPRLVQAASQMQAILSLVAGGSGIALVPQAMLAMKIPHVRFVELRAGESPVRYTLALAYHPGNRNPSLKAFVRAVQRHTSA